MASPAIAAPATIAPSLCSFTQENLNTLPAPVLKVAQLGLCLVDGLVELGGVARDADYQICECCHRQLF